LLLIFCFFSLMAYILNQSRAIGQIESKVGEILPLTVTLSKGGESDGMDGAGQFGGRCSGVGYPGRRRIHRECGPQGDRHVCRWDPLGGPAAGSSAEWEHCAPYPLADHSIGRPYKRSRFGVPREQSPGGV